MAPDTIPTRTAASAAPLAAAARPETAPPDPETLLTRRAAATALTAAGYPTAPATLARKASGGGPPYRRFGPRVIYRWADLLEWAEARLSPPIRSTSEADAA